MENVHTLHKLRFMTSNTNYEVERLTLPNATRDRLLRLLASPPAPTAALRKAAEKHAYHK